MIYSILLFVTEIILFFLLQIIRTTEVTSIMTALSQSFDSYFTLDLAVLSPTLFFAEG